MLLLPALITFSATVVTAVAVKKHHAILHYELDAVAYRSIPPSQFLLFTTNSTSAHKCSNVCNSNADCKYFSFYEMLANEETYCTYYKSSEPFGKLTSKERLIRGFRGYQKIVPHVKSGHGHKNGTSIDAHKTSAHHSAPTGTVIIVTPSPATTSSHSHEKGGENHGSTTKNHHSGDSSSITNKHGKSSEIGEREGEGPEKMEDLALVDKRFSFDFNSHEESGEIRDIDIPIENTLDEREASAKSCGLKCWSARVARGFNAFDA